MICKLIFLLNFVALFFAVTGEKCEPVAGFSGNRDSSGKRDGDDGSCECGISKARNAEGEENPKIIGGKVVQPPYKYPWMVAVYKKTQQICGAALITQTFVLTTAHCFQKMGVILPVDKRQLLCRTVEGKIVRCFEVHSMFRVGVNGKDTTVNKFYKVKRYINHPKYKVAYTMYDFALIELRRPIGCSPHTRPICLPDKVPAPRAGTEVIISGWGRTHQNPGKLLLTSKKLLEAKLKIQPKKFCKLINPLTKTHICAVGQEQGACVGDSGGPLFQAVNEKFYIFGLTSFGKDKTCNPRNPQFFSDVKQALDWIHQTANI